MLLSNWSELCRCRILANKEMTDRWIKKEFWVVDLFPFWWPSKTPIVSSSCPSFKFCPNIHYIISPAALTLMCWFLSMHEASIQIVDFCTTAGMYRGIGDILYLSFQGSYRSSYIKKLDNPKSVWYTFVNGKNVLLATSKGMMSFFILSLINLISSCTCSHISFFNFATVIMMGLKTFFSFQFSSGSALMEVWLLNSVSKKTFCSFWSQSLLSSNSLLLLFNVVLLLVKLLEVVDISSKRAGEFSTILSSSIGTWHVREKSIVVDWRKKETESKKRQRVKKRKLQLHYISLNSLFDCCVFFCIF